MSKPSLKKFFSIDGFAKKFYPKSISHPSRDKCAVYKLVRDTSVNPIGNYGRNSTYLEQVS